MSTTGAMCWNSETSGAFTALGVASAGAVWRLTGNRDMTKAILFFCLMELLQSVQYFFIAEDLLDAKCADAHFAPRACRADWRE